MLRAMVNLFKKQAAFPLLPRREKDIVPAVPLILPKTSIQVRNLRTFQPLLEKQMMKIATRIGSCVYCSLNTIPTGLNRAESITQGHFYPWNKKMNSPNHVSRHVPKHFVNTAGISCHIMRIMRPFLCYILWPCQNKQNSSCFSIVIRPWLWRWTLRIWSAGEWSNDQVMIYIQNGCQQTCCEWLWRYTSRQALMVWST